MIPADLYSIILVYYYVAVAYLNQVEIAAKKVKTDNGSKKVQGQITALARKAGMEKPLITGRMSGNSSDISPTFRSPGSDQGIKATSKGVDKQVCFYFKFIPL